MVTSTRSVVLAEHHVNWSAIFEAASKNSDFKEYIKDYMAIPKHQDIETVFSLYKEYPAGSGFLVRSPTTLVHIHDPFQVAPTRKHPTMKTGWLAFANLTDPTHVFKLDTMLGIMDSTKLHVPRLASLVDIETKSAIPLGLDINDGNFEELEIPNIASLPPFLAELANQHLADPDTLLIKVAAAIKAADQEQMAATGTPTIPPVKMQCKDLLQWIWAVGREKLPAHGNEVTILNEEVIRDAASRHFKSILPMPPRGTDNNPAPPGTPAGGPTGTPPDTSPGTPEGAVGATARTDPAEVTPDPSPLGTMSQIMNVQQQQINTLLGQMASYAANAAATPNKCDDDDFMKKWTGNASPFDKDSRTVQLLLQLEDPDTATVLPIEPPGTYKQFLTCTSEKGRLQILRNYFKLRDSSVNVNAALVSFFGEPTLTWMTDDAPSRFSLFAFAPHRQSLAEAMSNDLSLARIHHKICTDTDIKKLTQLRYTVDASCEHKMAEQLYNWRIALEFRYGPDSFVCKDVRANEDILKSQRDSFRSFRENVPNGPLSFFYRLDFNFNHLQHDLLSLSSRSKDNEVDMDMITMLNLRNYLNPNTTDVAKNIRSRSQTTCLINMPPRVIAQYSPKTEPTKSINENGKRPGGAGGDHQRDRKNALFTGARVNNDKINTTIKSYNFDQIGKIFTMMKGRNSICPKMGTASPCGKYHVRGWCTDDCDRLATHKPMSPDLEKKFNKFCQDAVAT
jgi:hypothetical protein